MASPAEISAAAKRLLGQLMDEATDEELGSLDKCIYDAPSDGIRVFLHGGPSPNIPERFEGHPVSVHRYAAAYEA